MPENIDGEHRGYKSRKDYWVEWLENNDSDAIVNKLVELEQSSDYDKLTGSLNRRGLEERLSFVTSSAIRKKSRLSFLFIDMDGLKKLNDSHDHETGDEAIKQVARAIQLRKYDITGRWGGDEFLVILPDTGQEGALLIADRIKDNLKGALTTVSIGVGVWDGVKDPLETINEADINMNLLKHSGLTDGERSKGIDVITLE